MTTPPPERITRQDFGISVRGYDRAQVDAYLGRVVEWLADAENRAAAAERARESLAREVAELRTTVTMLEERAGVPAPQSMSAFSERIGQVMESALQAAQELRAEAEQEASGRRASAAEEADRLVAGARDEAEKIVSDARREQQAIKENTEQLHSSRAEALDALSELQRRIADLVVDLPSPSSEGLPELGGAPDDTTGLVNAGETEDGETEGAAVSGGEVYGGDGVADDVTVMVPALVPDLADGQPDAGDHSEATAGVLVTATPTIVQPAVGTDADGRSRGGARRSA